MLPKTTGPSYAAAYDQKDAGKGESVYLPVLLEDALVFSGDPHGAITGTGVSMNVRARITLLKSARASDHRGAG